MEQEPGRTEITVVPDDLYRKMAKYNIVRANKTDDGTPMNSVEAV
jgi:hypothetical protein